MNDKTALGHRLRGTDTAGFHLYARCLPLSASPLGNLLFTLFIGRSSAFHYAKSNSHSNPTLGRGTKELHAAHHSFILFGAKLCNHLPERRERQRAERGSRRMNKFQRFIQGKSESFQGHEVKAARILPLSALICSPRIKENKAAKVRTFSGNEHWGSFFHLAAAQTVLPVSVCVEPAKRTHPRQSRSTLRPACNTCRSLSACIADLDTSQARCSCACIIIPDHHSGQHLHVATSNASDVNLHYWALFALLCPAHHFSARSPPLSPFIRCQWRMRNLKSWLVNEWRL